MSISAVKLNENGDQCDASSSKVTPREITGVMPLVMPAFSKTFGWTEVGCVFCFKSCQLRSPFCQGCEDSACHPRQLCPWIWDWQEDMLWPGPAPNAQVRLQSSPNPCCGPSSDCCCPGALGCLVSVGPCWVPGRVLLVEGMEGGATALDRAG